MSEVAAPIFNERERARDLIRAIAGHCWHGRGDMIDRVFDAVRRVYPKATWTRRRIRALWHREAAGVRWGEMNELEVVAAIEQERREAALAARDAHNDFIAHIATTLDRLEQSDADFHREHRAALCALAVGQAVPASGHAAGKGYCPAAQGRPHLGSADTQ